MKNCFGFTSICLGCLTAAFFSAAAQPSSPAKGAAPAKTDNRPKMSAGSVSNSAEPDVPLSQFVLPANPKAGRDPFFPGSMHPYASKPSTNKPVAAEVTLTLNGITPGKFVMINGRTFSEGEEGDIKTTGGGSAHVRCLKIKEDSAIIQVDGVQRELRLRQGI